MESNAADPVATLRDGCAVRACAEAKRCYNFWIVLPHNICAIREVNLNQDLKSAKVLLL